MKKTDVLIIGSGISSLTCAALLTRSGKSVTVLEQHSKAGGYLHCFARFGRKFDTGAHYVGALDEGQPFWVLLNYLGVYEKDLFIPLDPTGFDHHYFPDFTYAFPKGYDAVIHSLQEKFPNDGPAIIAYFNLIRKAVTHFPTYEFDDSSDRDIKSLLEFSETSLQQVVAKLTTNPKLQYVFYSYCMLHGVMPADTPFGFHAIVTDSLIRGSYGLRQGGDALTKNFVKQIESNGGQVLTKRRVTRLNVVGKEITEAITDDGEVYSGDWVISGIHPKNTFALISDPEILSSAFKERLNNLKESVGIFGIYGMAKGELLIDPLRNYYFHNSSNPSNLMDMSGSFKVPNCVFVSVADRGASKKGGGSPINIHAPAPFEWFEPWKDSLYGERPAEYEAFKKSYAENVFALIESHLPGFRSTLSDYVTSSPLSALHFNGTAEGSAYGIYHSIQNTGARSLGPRTKINNLLLTGQNSLFPGLMGASVSALRTSGHIIGIKPILSELKQMLKR